MSTSTQTTQAQTFEVEVCRTGFGFSTITAPGDSEYAAQQWALDQAGDYLYDEKSSDYALCNPVPSPAEQARIGRPAMELILQLEGDELSRVGGARFDFDHRHIARLVGLSELVKGQGLSEVRYFATPDLWMGVGQDSGGLSGSEMVVSGTWFSLAGHDDNGADCDVRSMCVEITTLMRAFDEGANRLVVLSTGDLSFIEDAGIFDDDRGIEGLVVTTPFEVMPQEALERAFEDYCGHSAKPRE